MPIKRLPLNELRIVAVVEVFYDPDAGENGETTVKMEVMSGCQELWDKFPMLLPKDVIFCDCCGHKLKYVCAILHTPTGEGFFIGRDCANKIASLQHDLRFADATTVAMAERIACDRRERAFIQAHPEAAPVIAAAKASPMHFIQELVAKLRQYGTLSDKQIAAMASTLANDKQRRAIATRTAPTGRCCVSGTLLSVKKVPNRFKRFSYDPDFTLKMTVDLDGGVRVHGTLPRGCESKPGSVIYFAATFEPSQNDPLFGFFKNPVTVKSQQQQPNENQLL